MVFGLNDNADIYYHNDKPYVEYYLDKKYLTGITIFCSSDSVDIAHNDAREISDYIFERGYNAKVRVEIFEQ